MFTTLLKKRFIFWKTSFLTFLNLDSLHIFVFAFKCFAISNVFSCYWLSRICVKAGHGNFSEQRFCNMLQGCLTLQIQRVTSQSGTILMQLQQGFLGVNFLLCLTSTVFSYFLSRQLFYTCVHSCLIQFFCCVLLSNLVCDTVNACNVLNLNVYISTMISMFLCTGTTTGLEIQMMLLTGSQCHSM